MMETWLNASLTLVAIPILGGLLGLALWKWPRIFQAWTLAFLAVTGMILTMYSGPSSDDPTSSILMALIILAAFFSVLGHNQTTDTPATLFLTLVFVGLGLGFMTSVGGDRASYLGEIFVLVGMALFYYQFYTGNTPHEGGWGPLGLYGLALTCLAISVLASGPMATIALAVAFVVTFPLFPFHGAFIATVSNLPGSLPAFLVVLLPSLGFSGMSALIPTLPDWFIQVIFVLALLSALYGALKALVQFRMGHLLAYAFLTQMGIVWWYMAIKGTPTPQVVMYFSALALVTSSLYLAGHYLRIRFGHLDMDKMGGVAHSMPRFATILVVLITAAMGLPVFAVFSAFFEMMLHLSTGFLWSIPVILTIWFMMSWLYPRLMHKVLFGRPLVPSFPYRDLCSSELLPLILMVLVMMLAGLVPSNLIVSTNSPVLSFHVEEVETWKP